MASSFGIFLIVNNEEKYIKRGIESFLKCADEVIIVDTGSNDNTIPIIQSINDNRVKLYNMEWPFDFSVARNYAMSLTTSQFILSMDGDEYFDDDLIETFNQLKSNNFNNCNYIELNLENFSDGKSYGIRHGERVVVSKDINPQYKYCVHEKIYTIGDRVTYSMPLTDGRIIHTHDGNLWGRFDTYRQMYYNDINNIPHWDYERKSHYWYYFYYTMLNVDRPLALHALTECYNHKSNFDDYDYRIELKKNNTISDNDFISLVMANLSNPSKDDCELIAKLYNTVDYHSDAFEILSYCISDDIHKEGFESALNRFFESYCLKTYNNMNVLAYLNLSEDFIKEFPENNIAKHNIKWNSDYLRPRIDETMCIIYENNLSPSVIYYVSNCFKHVIVLNDGNTHECNISYSNIKRCYNEDEIKEYQTTHNIKIILEITPNKPIYLKEFSNIFNKWLWLTKDSYLDDAVRIKKV